ncbi:hypothetical protein [Streptomyces sp. NPDC056405]|uniref:hypothetical protein n=1 Tax=Streptomyces sp. NPDC056405 TaxID=3345811 RepID=UPI0035DD058F
MALEVATENPELWTFLKRLRLGQRLTGTVASTESLGVFVVLDEGPVARSILASASSRIRDVLASLRVNLGDRERMYCEFLQFQRLGDRPRSAD